MELHHLTATKARELFNAKELSPVELLDAVVARTAAVEPSINALTEEMLEDGLRRRPRLAGTFRKPGTQLRALEGIPAAAQGRAADCRTHLGGRFPA